MIKLESVRPEQSELVRPEGLSDNRWAYIQSKGSKTGDSRGIV